MRPGTALLRAMGGGGAPLPTQTTLDPAYKSSDIILSAGNTEAESNGSAGGFVRSLTTKNSGLFYVEFECIGLYSTTPGCGVGIAAPAASFSDFIGQRAGEVGWWSQSDNVNRRYEHGSLNNLSSHTPTIGDRVAMAINLNTGKMWATQPGISGWLGGGNPAAGTSPTIANLAPFRDGSGYVYFAACPRRGDASNASDRNKWRLVDPSAWAFPAGGGLPSGFGVWT